MTKRRGRIGVATAGIAALSLAFSAAAVAAPGHVPGPPATPPGQDAAPPPGQADNPGHTKQAAKAAKPSNAATPSHPAHPATPSRNASTSHPAHPSHPATPSSSTSTSAAPHVTPVSPHAQAGKETICHATGSATNPYVEITISRNAIPAHSRHQDGRDIIPAPAGGCPGGNSTTTTTEQSTSSSSTTAVNGAVTGSSVAAAIQHAVVHKTKTPRSVAVLGARAHGGPSPAAARVRALKSSFHGGSLPFTGLAVFSILALGAALLFSGLAVRSRT